MNGRLLDLLCCPLCRGGLQLTVFQHNNHYDSEGPDCRDEIVKGLLRCGCGASFPVIEGVPRLLEDGLNAFPDFIAANREEIEGAQALSKSLDHNPRQREKDSYEGIRVTYSKEWQLFDYSDDKTWGWTLEDRKRVFLSDVGLSETQLRGKLLLDAGCGNGTLTAALSSFGTEVLGIDLNDGLGLANRSRSRISGDRSDAVHFVQGNLVRSPLKKESFDIVYCSGAVHRTPDSKETFKQLVPLLKKGGRLFVWVSGRRNVFVRAYADGGRQLKKLMSLDSLLVVCRILAPFHKLGGELLNAVGLVNFRRRTLREVTLDLFDLFAPQYENRHTEAEVQDWFREQGFMNVVVSGRQKHGFGVYGDKI